MASSNRTYDTSSSHLSPNSYNRSYFTDQAVRSGYGAPVDSREAEFHRYPNDLRDPVEREIEKGRIRAEIMAEQRERGRILEEEVRMELMLEREVALKRWEFSRMRFDSSSEIRPFVNDPSTMRSDAPPEIRPFVHEPSRMRSDAPEIRPFVDEHSRMRSDAPSEIRQFVHEHSRMQTDAPPEIRPFVHEPSRMRSDAPEIRPFVVEHSRMRSDAPSEIRQFVHEHSRMQTDAPSEIRPFVHEPLRIPQPSGYLKERRMPLLAMVPSHPVVGDRILGSSSFQHHPMLPTTSNLALRDTNPLSERSKDRVFGSSPFQHHLMPSATSNMVLREMKPFPEPRKERILLAKHEPNASDLSRKRKASTLGSDHHRSSNLDKKPKGRWSCQLCKISTTSEKTLKDHIKGKKHKLMMEEGMTPEKISNPVTKDSTPNTDKPGPSHPNVKRTPKPHEKSSETSRAEATNADKKQKSKVVETSRAEATMVNKKQKCKMDETPRSEATMVDKKQKSDMNGSLKTREQRPAPKAGDIGSASKNKFWCAICQVGVNSQIVLSNHEKGRRHMENLMEKRSMKH